MQAKKTCRIAHWCIHEVPMTAEQKERIQKEYPDTLPYLVTGQVVEDSAGRWNPGECCQSTIAIAMTDTVIETRNTQYILEGPGRRAVGIPRDYASEVGKTIMLAGGATEAGDGYVLIQDNVPVLP